MRTSRIIALIILTLSAGQASAVDFGFTKLVLKGDSCFQNQDYTNAIIQYEKARKLNSGHSLLNQNLTAAYQNTSNSANVLFIEELNSPLHKLFNPRLINLFSFLSYLLIGLSVFQFLKSTLYGKASKWNLVLYIVSFLLVLISIGTYQSKEDIAIVTGNDVLVLESTTETADVITSLQPGYKVTLLEIYDEWSKIELPTKQTGWMRNKQMEIL